MIRDDSGKLALESAMLFPILFIFTVSALFLAMGMGLHSAVYMQSESASSRAAFVWDNSFRNPVTGAFHPGMYDDLYWRLTSDFGDSKLAGKKLNNTLSVYGEIADKQGEYDNLIWIRQITALFHGSFPGMDWFQSGWSKYSYQTDSTSIVAEPAEWIRNVELARLYWPIIHKSISRDESDQMIEEFRKRPGNEKGPLAFHSHNEARAYLQQSVNGKLSREQTDDVGEWRMIDALDRNQISHQVYFGMKSYNKDMKDQLLKDAELLRKGKVNGVTWHFFRRSRDGSLGLSDSLRTQLEKRGIVVVIHE